MQNLDKEAQEKIAKGMFQLGFLVGDKEIEHRWKHLQISVKRQWHDKADSLTEIFEELGYRQPLDRPELRKGIAPTICKVCGLTEENQCNIDEGGCVELQEYLDQILALIIPEGEPQLLSNEELLTICLHPSLDERGTIETVRAVAQAQRKADIKYYTGE